MRVKARGSAKEEDAAVVAAEFTGVPGIVSDDIDGEDIEVVACQGHVLDAGISLSTITPQNWPRGMTWARVPGVYVPDHRTVIVATWDRPDGRRYVPAAGDRHPRFGGHGSLNLAVHELMHGYDLAHWPQPFRSSDDRFKDAWRADRALGVLRGPETSPAYYTNDENGPREAYAESAARLFGLDRREAASWPNLARFWSDMDQAYLQAAPRFEAEPAPEPSLAYPEADIGLGRVLDDGSLQLDLEARGAKGEIGHARLIYAPDDPDFAAIADHLFPQAPDAAAFAPLRPGAVAAVRPF